MGCLTPGKSLREVINRSWNDLLGAWQIFQPRIARLDPDDHTSKLTWDRWLLPLFAELGYGQLQRNSEATVIDGKEYSVGHRHDQALVHLLGWNVPISTRTAGVVGAAKASPHSMVQELLNRSDVHLWAVVSNGRQLRILRDNASLTRAAFVEFDLEQMFTDGVFSDFVALWLLVHASRLEGDPQTQCWLETWATEAREQGVRALDALGQGFIEAIEALGLGFLSHPANAQLRERLRTGALDQQDYYRQILRVVYRLVFLLVAEDRGLLFPPGTDDEAKARYSRYYSLSRLRHLARRRRGTRHSDLWDQFRIVTRSLGPEGQPALGLPPLNSLLWDIVTTGDVDGSRIANVQFLSAVRHVCFVLRDQALHRIDYRNLGSEELGSVYESLLELSPDIDVDAATFSLSHSSGNERKTTGSYYTPSSLISTLLDSALDPVLDAAEAGTDPETALLDLKVLDPACGSGHFLVAAGQRIARRLAALRTGESNPPPEDARHALREVVGRCLYGADINPMAVELCKVSLWLESVEPGKPLSFLDHHIVCGNSLLGATPELIDTGVPDNAFKALTGDDKTVVTSWKRRNSAERSGQGAFDFSTNTRPGQTLAADLAAIDHLPDDSPVAVAEKAALFESLVASDSMARAKFAADAWCAAFVAEKTPEVPPITTAVVRHALDHGVGGIAASTVDVVRRLADEYHFLHPHIAFPQVVGAAENAPVGGSSGTGFDAVVGNPPWEKVQLREKEFFARTAPDVAAAAGASRKRMIAALAESDPPLFASFQSALRHAEGESAYLRASGRYLLNGRGQINTYAVFAELMRSLIAPTGRCGMIVPSGIATDDTTKHFFGDIVGHQSLASLYDFENSAGIFPGVHRSYKFSILTLSGSDAPIPQAEFAFFCRRTEDLRNEGRRFTLTPEELSLVNPNTKTCPVFRSRRDAELTIGIYRRVPVLVCEGAADGNPWGISVGRGLFNMTTDSGLFSTAAENEAVEAILYGNVYRGTDGKEWLPLYEGKMVHHFDHRWAGVGVDGDFTDLKSNDKANPETVSLPRYWVAAKEVYGRLPGDQRWLLGFRSICRAADERTVIAAAIPLAGVGDSMSIIVDGVRDHSVPLLAASLTSFALDYAARQKIGGSNLNLFLIKQFAVLPPTTYKEACPWDTSTTLAEWLTHRILELTYTAGDLAPFAADLGYDGPPFRWDDERRALLRAEVDACFFHLYGIERGDVEYIMGTFPIVRRKDEAAFGEYRTAGLILECYDSMAKATDTGVRYQTILDPPPSDPSTAHPS